MRLQPCRHLNASSRYYKAPRRPQDPQIIRRPKSTIFSIPLKLLRLIFKFLTATSTDNAPLQVRETRMNVLALSQVCRLWRNASFGDPLIWLRALDLRWHSLKLTERFLNLSNPLTLDIGDRSCPFPIHGSHGLQLLELLCQHRHRIREWNVHYDLEGYQGEVNHWFLLSHMPQLNAVRCSGSPPSHPSHTHCPALSMAQDIRSLKLDGCDFQLLQGRPISSLTELSVRNIPQASRPTLNLWMTILTGMPSLRFLAIQNSMGSSGPPMLSYPSLPLQRLRVLVMGDQDPCRMDMLLALFKLIICPSLACLRVDLSSSLRRTESDNSQIPIAIDLPSGTWKASQPLEMAVDALSCVTIGNIHQSEVAMNWNGEAGAEGVASYLGSSDGDLGVSFRVSDVVSSTALDEAFISLRHLFSSASSFKIAIDPRAILSQVPNGIFTVGSRLIFDLMDNLRTLILDYASGVMVLSCLCARRWAFRGSVAVVNLVGLECLCIEQAALLTGDTLQDLLVQYLTWRFELGLPLEKVGIRNSYVSEEAKAQLHDLHQRSIFSVLRIE
ncbi:hypothetical protein FA15DRAFT_733953 [Coprinopsis marcescibilis]|uniref:Uncharacterized protein n=1 Tax=Coprinopsis marcescibilis TaxID=230819 RepID=A0A5C3KCI1_COPMA|nr:hypothetical protein FA15DRAFT_733953 [Coprinopsis marcescibilis]